MAAKLQKVMAVPMSKAKLMDNKLGRMLIENRNFSKGLAGITRKPMAVKVR